MIAYAVYVISIDGRTIVSKKFQSADSIPNELLLGALFTALDGVAKEMTKSDSELKHIEIDNLSYHIKSFGHYRIVFVTDLAQTPEDVIQKLGFSFMKDYGEQLLEGFSDIHPYRPFKDTISQIIDSEPTISSDQSNTIIPTMKFSSSVIFDLPEQVQSTALAMITLIEGTIEDISTESGNTTQDTSMHISSLQKMGLIGKKFINNHILYFCSF